ncbi:ribbon-helix-helix domain-containing protein [Thalassospira sp. UBA1131]|jgi:predicted DNA-binding ribbon-helix-helix protein|uniref:ribbon-helix-helix domain-containing protein n=1 Tax=Thalassospira sp. UBA1131 TaxID=1947672 RepID=UPI0025E49719|nr:ribbon-helix-helix domain-containing protein [Thalassospira sp. UBA1131]
MEDAVRKRSVTIAGHRTSFSLEDAFWEELVGIAQRRAMTLAELVVEIDTDREGNLSSALRLYVLRDLQSRLAGDKHEVELSDPESLSDQN